MILETTINNTIEINKLEDLSKLKYLEENGLKTNKSRLARKLDVDRRTVGKYIKGYTKSSTRKKKNQFDKYYDNIKRLLDDQYKVFEYKRVLWQYLKDNYDMEAPESSFRHYINSIPEFKEYFKDKTKRKVQKPSLIRYETDKGQQAQLDWKESLKVYLNTIEVVYINIFVLILSYSRFRVYRVSISKTQEILLNFLNDAFGLIGGVPKEILCDNMKTVMDEPRTEYTKGIINNKFKQFADDYGFKVKPCLAGRPNTKAKVEAPMKILDEIKAYGSDLDYEGIVRLVEKINDRENFKFHKSYDTIPILGLEKEKDFLQPLPRQAVRNQYKIKTVEVMVNSSSMITYENNQYSVPPKYIKTKLQLQHYDNQIHLYSNTKLVAVHDISSAKINYKEEHYTEILKITLPHDDKKIESIAKENLRLIGERYKS